MRRRPRPHRRRHERLRADPDAWLRAVRPQAARHGVRIVIVELPLVATPMAAPTYGSAPRGALSPGRAARRVLRGLESPRTLHSPPWARLGAVLSQAALAADAAGSGGRVLRRLSARDSRAARTAHGPPPEREARR